MRVMGREKPGGGLPTFLPLFDAFFPFFLSFSCPTDKLLGIEDKRDRERFLPIHLLPSSLPPLLLRDRFLFFPPSIFSYSAAPRRRAGRAECDSEQATDYHGYSLRSALSFSPSIVLFFFSSPLSLPAGRDLLSPEIVGDRREGTRGALHSLQFRLPPFPFFGETFFFSLSSPYARQTASSRDKLDRKLFAKNSSLLPLPFREAFSPSLRGRAEDMAARWRHRERASASPPPSRHFPFFPSSRTGHATKEE